VGFASVPCRSNLVANLSISNLFFKSSVPSALGIGVGTPHCLRRDAASGTTCNFFQLFPRRIGFPARTTIYFDGLAICM
jgi:hypothetical protein